MRRWLAKDAIKPLSLLTQTAAVRKVDATTPLRPRRGVATALLVEGDMAVLDLVDRQVALPAVAEPALRQLLTGPSTPAALQLGGLDGSGRDRAGPPDAPQGVVVQAAQSTTS